MEQAYEVRAKPADDDLVFKNRYIILGIILTGILMAVMDGNVVSIALPTITQYFHVDVGLSQWTITAYFLTMTALLLVFGKLSEFFGKARLYIIGFSIFTVSSLACGFAPGIYELITFRIVQAIGGAMVASLGGAIIFTTFPPGERGRAIGFIGATTAIACIVGPVLGGFLVESFGWGSVFLINVPIGVALVAAALKYLKVKEQKPGRFTMDWAGTALLIVTMTALVIFIRGLSENPLTSIQMLAPGAIFAIGLTLFVFQESRHRSPLVELSIFKGRKFTLPLLAMLISFITSLMMSVIGPFFFQGAMGYSPLSVGLVLFISPAVMVFGSPVCGWLYDRYPFKFYSAVGMLIMSVSFALTGIAVMSMDMTLVIAGFVLGGIGGAMFQSPNSMEAMTALPIQKAGIASSVTSTVRNLGMTLGVSLGTFLLLYQLSISNYTGPVLEAGTALLSGVVSNTMYIGAGLCLIGATISLIRNLK